METDRKKTLFIFAGTTEGRDFTAEFLERLKRKGGEGKNWRVHIFTATEYGGELLRDVPETLEIHTGRLDFEGILRVLARHTPEYTVDCTHPHALEISLNLRTACAQSNRRYLRLSRSAVKPPAGLPISEFANLEEAADFLRTQDGNILLATGSKELRPFALPELRDRVFARVLPLEESIRACKTLGFKTKNTIAMQGPFSAAMNRAILKEISASWLVTKDSGTEGGLAEKLSAAEQEGVGVIMIRRPAEPDALSAEEIFTVILPESGASKKLVYLIGAGCGGSAGMTSEALRAIKDCRRIVGSPRLLADAESLITGKPRRALTGSAEIIACIGENDDSPVGILFSGDIGFYSGAKRLIPLLKEQSFQCAIIPGVSSLSYFSAKLGVSWDDAKIVSLHGRTANILSAVLYRSKTFFLTGGETGASYICKVLNGAGLGGLTLHVGEKLSYPDERITTGTAAVLSDQKFDSLAVVMVENPSPRSGLGNYSLPDAEFTRGAVPMTKEEIRAVSLSKLRIEENSTAWDIGAGTGSVACEMALRARNGWVYAVEQNSSALFLIEENRKKLGIFNLTAVSGTAPDALTALPPPDRVFIGGSSGKLEPILEAVLAKNPRARVVINGITLETANAGASLLKKYAFQNADIVQISAAKAEPAGNAHLLKALNPVFIISGDG
ncbi:MAG: precorrin-6A reductase [Spirochaetaceae bacterium]|jgi:precorrin-6Y C5,15-methyltransferase (decarboxylating)|nr:precorrin-6A reductase [Spirochaetaceae bacterium]